MGTLNGVEFDMNQFFLEAPSASMVKMTGWVEMQRLGQDCLTRTVFKKCFDVKTSLAVFRDQKNGRVCQALGMTIEKKMLVASRSCVGIFLEKPRDIHS